MYAIEATDETPETMKISSIANALSKDYQPSDSNKYIFNEDISQDQNYKIYMYAIDDKGFESNIYETVVTAKEGTLPKITDIETTSTSNKINITNVTTDQSEGLSYRFSIGDEPWSAWGEEQTHNFDNLNPSTSYNINVQVKDINNNISNVLSKVVKTSDYQYPSIDNFEVSEETLDSLKVSATITKGEGTITDVEFQISDDENWYKALPEESKYSYTFTGLNSETEYTFKIKITDSNGKIKEYNNEDYSGKTLLPFYKTCDETNLACHIAKLTSQEDEKVIYHDGSNALDASDYSYRYSGADYVVTDNAKEQGYDSIYDIITIHCGDKEQTNDFCWSAKATFSLKYEEPTNTYTTFKEVLDKAIQEGYIQGGNMNNYVCLASNKELCSNKGDLFRILGIYDNDGNYQTKLISADILDDSKLKADSIPNHYIYYLGLTPKIALYKWSVNRENNSADWDSSVLNSKLNTEYLEYLKTLNTNIDNMIVETNWKVGGINNVSKTNKLLYNDEVINNSNSKLPKQIGLIYLTDYTYSVDSAYWNSTSYDASRYHFWDNWMYIGTIEWSITPYIDTIYNKTYYFNYSGYGPSYVDGQCSIRPTFYLKSNVKYDSGIGTIDDPYIISVGIN